MSASRQVARKVAIGKTLQRVFESPDGRLALVHLMKKAGLLEAVHEEVPGRNDYNNGRRAVVLELLSDLRYDYGRLLEFATAMDDDAGDPVFSPPN